MMTTSFVQPKQNSYKYFRWDGIISKEIKQWVIIPLTQCQPCLDQIDGYLTFIVKESAQADTFVR